MKLTSLNVGGEIVPLKKRRDSAVDEEEESAGVVRTGDEVEGGARRERSGLATSCTITEKMGRTMKWESY